MRYKTQILTADILQCVFRKYIITYQNILRKGVVRPHLVESSYCKTLEPLKGAPILLHFLHKKYF